MPDPFMPDVVVEIAFNAGYTTPDASRTWTDVSSYVELTDKIAITVGRQDERSTADANTLTLTLDNKDGQFTAGRSESPYYPNVKIGRPIRVTVTPPGGSASRRFVGFIDEWPVEWDGSDAYAKTTVRAASRLARLGLSTKLRSVVGETILFDPVPPLAYWTLGDPAAATNASDSSGSALSVPLVRVGDAASVVFGVATGPGFDDMTAATFTSSPARHGLRADFAIPVPGQFSLRASVLLNALPTSTAYVVSLDADRGIGVTTGGLITGIATVGPSINDGATHDVVLTRDFDGLGWSEGLYVDGVLVDSASGAPTAYPSNSSVYVGLELSGVIAHVAVYGYALDPTQASDQAMAILTGYAGDTADERIKRMLAWAGVPAAEVNAEVGAETLAFQQTAGQSAVDAIRLCESTEGGVLFDGRDGKVTFHNRSHRYLAATAATLNMASQHVGSDFSPKVDRSSLVNDATVDNPTTEESARKVDTASRDEYGVATASASAVPTTYDAIQQKANWIVASYAEPRTRVPSLTVDVLAHQGLTPSAQTLLGLTVGDLLAVTNAPTQADTTSQSYFVEGYTETIGPESYGITFNLSPTHPTLTTLVLDSATRGLLGTGVLAL